MIFGGFQKSSLIEYPGKISAVVFTIGCNFRCPFCQNYRLVIPEKYPQDVYSEDDILKYLQKKKNLIDALSITGGEPTLHNEELIRFMRMVKKIGLLLQLETNGTNPEFIEKAISEGLIDYVAMDIKGPLDKYPALTGIKKVNIHNIIKSVNIILNQAPDYEFRTTFVPLLKIADFHKIGKLIKGAKKYIIQKFEKQDVLSPQMFLGMKEPTKQEALQAAEIVKEYVSEAIIRGFSY